MTPARLAPLLALLPLVALGACSGDDAQRAVDAGAGDASGSSGAAALPPPAPTGPASTTGLVTVLEKPGGTVMCLGAVAESAPPQCDGPRLVGWDWGADQVRAQGSPGGRWGSFALTGEWDGERLAVADQVPAALWSPLREEEPDLPEGPGESTDAFDGVPGVMGARTWPDGTRLVEVVYDDGSLQEWFDETYEGRTVLDLAMEPAEPSSGELPG